jgi:heat shock protein HtpX
MGNSPWGHMGHLGPAPAPWGLPHLPDKSIPTAPDNAIEDEPLGATIPPSSQTVGIIRKFDFRGAIRANQRRTTLLFVALGVSVLLIGAFLGAGLSSIFPGPLLKPEWILGGSALVGLVSSFVLVWSLWGANEATLSQAGAIHVTGKETGPLGVYARRLHNVTQEMALASGLPMPEVYLIDDAALNAFAVGWRPEKASVAATIGLVTSLTREELQAVMAHELAHIAQRDTSIMVTALAIGSAVSTMVAIMYDALFRTVPWAQGGASGGDDKKLSGAAFRLIFALAAYLAAWLIATIVLPIIQMAISRQREYRADALAAKFTRNPASLASALLRIEQNPYASGATPSLANLYISNPLRTRGRQALRSLMDTHPPIKARVARLTNLTDD